MKLVPAILFLASVIPGPATDTSPKSPKGEFAPGAKEADLSNPATLPPAKAKAFTATADEITATGFVSIAKDGTRDLHLVTKDTVILQANKPANFTDLKAGDTVTGLRALTEAGYTVTKITKFVSKPAKPPKPAGK